MASLNSDSVIWTIGDATGRAPSGESATIPVSVSINSGHGAPTGDPTSPFPLYADDDTDDLWVWTGAAWIGPYVLTVSG